MVCREFRKVHSRSERFAHAQPGGTWHRWTLSPVGHAACHSHFCHNSPGFTVQLSPHMELWAEGGLEVLRGHLSLLPSSLASPTGFAPWDDVSSSYLVIRDCRLLQTWSSSMPSAWEKPGNHGSKTKQRSSHRPLCLLHCTPIPLAPSAGRVPSTPSLSFTKLL